MAALPGCVSRTALRRRAGRTVPHGVTLVGLMVGMVIALFAVIAALSLYRNAMRTVYAEGGLVPGAALEGQLASGLLSAQIALQGAGFGIGGAAAGSQLLLLSGSTLAGQALGGTVVALTSARQNGNALVWTSNPALSANTATYVCQALLSDPTTRALYLLQASGNCHPLTKQWSQVTWTQTTLVAPAVLASAVSLSARSDSNCWPFGAVPKVMSTLDPPAASVEVQLGYGTGVSGVGNSYTLCLANLVA
jgi:hypothetical protein